jgi:hypothetical protein
MFGLPNTHAVKKAEYIKPATENFIELGVDSNV